LVIGRYITIIELDGLKQERQAAAKNRILMAPTEGEHRWEINQFPNIFRIMINGLVYFVQVKACRAFMAAQGARNLTNGKSLLHVFTPSRTMGALANDGSQNGQMTSITG